jgi:hypothetical protein
MTDLAELRRCVQALAQPALVQVSLFPDFAAVGDELAGQFEDAMLAYRASAPTARSAQSLSLKQLADYLTELSGPKDSDFWCDNAVLASDVRWQRVRDLARMVLATFDWPDEPPPRDGAIYVCEEKVVHNT